MCTAFAGMTMSIRSCLNENVAIFFPEIVPAAFIVLIGPIWEIQLIGRRQFGAALLLLGGVVACSYVACGNIRGDRSGDANEDGRYWRALRCQHGRDHEDLSATQSRGREVRQRGVVVGIGPFDDLGNMAIFKTRAAAEEFIQEDPFILEGVVKSIRIHDWKDSLLPE